MQTLKSCWGLLPSTLQGHAVAFGVGASTNNLWLYLLKVLASFFFSIVWVFSASSTSRTALFLKLFLQTLFTKKEQQEE